MSFVDHVITKNDLRVGSKKVEAADVPTVQRFFGLVKYLSKFLQHLPEMCQRYAT